MPPQYQEGTSESFLPTDSCTFAMTTCRDNSSCVAHHGPLMQHILKYCDVKTLFNCIFVNKYTNQVLSHVIVNIALARSLKCYFCTQSSISLSFDSLLIHAFLIRSLTFPIITECHGSSHNDCSTNRKEILLGYIFQSSLFTAQQYDEASQIICPFDFQDQLSSHHQRVHHLSREHVR